MDQLVALVHHAYLFWAGGQRGAVHRSGGARPACSRRTLPTDLARSTHSPGTCSSPNAGCGRRPWRTRPHEPLDGIFVHHSASGALRVLGVLGVHADRDGFTVVEADRAARARGLARRIGAVQQRAAGGRSGRPVLHRGRERTDRTRLALAGTRASTGHGGRGTLMITTPGPSRTWTRRAPRRCSSRSRPSSSSRARIPSASAPSAPHRKPSRGCRVNSPPPWPTARSPRTKGIGPATLQIVLELVTTGRASLLEDLRDQVPPGLVDMLQIPGLGVAKIRQIHDTLKIDSIAGARGGRASTAASPSFPASARRPRRTSSRESASCGRRVPGACRTTPRRRRRCCARRWDSSRACARPSSRATCGAAPRWCATSSSCSPSEAPPAELFAQLSELPGVSEFAGQDERRVTLRFAGGSAAQVIVTTPVNLGAVLVQATGQRRAPPPAGGTRRRPWLSR